MARRPLHPEDARLWSLVTATVRPSKGRKPPAKEAMPAIAALSLPASEFASPDRSKKSSAKLANVDKGIAVTHPLALAKDKHSHLHPGRLATTHHPMRHHFPEGIEPRRKRRISTAREPIGGRLDLHGLDQDQARVAVHSFIQRAYQDGVRAVLIITGKGALGDGVLRRRTPDWLAEPAVRPMVAGLSQAERHHGGEGALYVALKRALHP